MDYTDLKEVLKIAESAVGKTIGEIDKTDRSAKKTKGGAGHVIEESLFGYDINSKSEADFPELELELKTTPVKENKNKTLSAKERLVLNIIDYMKEAEATFETSSFWKKNKRLLIIFYLWKKELDFKDYTILESLLFDYPEEDLEIIKNDWEIINQKILDGKAHELSEGDTMYLGACTKGASAKSVREQPFSDIPAKQRAYSLKQSYMTTLVRKHIDNESFESIARPEDLKTQSFEEILEAKFSPYYGKSLDEIAKELGLDLNMQFKSRVQQVISEILSITGNKLDRIEEFAKANIEFKTVRLEPNGMPREHMSFEQIDFNRWLEDDFEDSQIYERFETTKFLFVIFKYKEVETNENKGSRQLYFEGIKLWNMPEETIQNEVFELWQAVRQKLKEGVEIVQVPYGKSFRNSNNLPGTTFNGVTHIRPKARDGKDQVKLPDGQMIAKQTYWLNREYVAQIVKDVRFDEAN